MEQNKIQIYQTADGETRIDVRLVRDTVWLSQAQMVELFGRDQSAVSRHIRNALAEGEVSEKSNMQKMHIANSDRPVVMYDLDEVFFDNETLWRAQKKIAELFERDRSVITKHLNNIFNEGELDEKVVCAYFAHTTQHGAMRTIA